MNKEEAIETLREWIKPNDILYTQLQHVSKSGMTRHIAIRKIKNDYPFYYTRLIAKAL